ncbi:hypothetical protein [Clostridium kluyveri]|uniref:Uncharacterized protein n=1 Tax=Clostridium kluyveri (strain ATCC 8527 / DSM 555 / NBRC 12016 / NCIMB 10680 / K1) TaxID=431943 RepID=A5N759_CLOK5|nr:hypothetical protein [Clostridium kluyveri]EDK33140.1 Hypothetical protein CKL_1098 [Clostridium kluyveri DSM 555]
MIYNLERMFDDMISEDEEEMEITCIKEAENLIKMGMDLLTVIRITGLEWEEIGSIKKYMN